MDFDQKLLQDRLSQRKSLLSKDPILAPRKAEVLRRLNAVLKGLKRWKGDVMDLLPAMKTPEEVYALAALLTPPQAGKRQACAELVAQQPSIFLGDLHVKGLLHVASTVVVVGSLEAKEVSVGETGVLVVAGDLTTRACTGDGWLLVGGNLEARLALGYHEAGVFNVAGTLRADLAIFSDHGANIAKDRSKHSFDFQKLREPNAAYKKLEKLVNPAALAPEGESADLGVLRVDFRELRRLAVEGKKPLLVNKSTRGG
ncbi:MAG: hypothetical protein HY901_04805 [Deltaproteobacteria bacterium]|nr:hypothetical protein [Deltaproteobacteria bacterium]